METRRASQGESRLKQVMCGLEFFIPFCFLEALGILMARIINSSSSINLVSGFSSAAFLFNK
jgi:hypothetical protein